MKLSNGGLKLLKVFNADILDGAFIIPEFVTQISDSAFYHCANLLQIRIPESVTKIGNDTFHSCTSLTQIAIPDCVTQIGDRAFFCCTGLTQIMISKSVTQIGDGAFAYCTSLTQIMIPESVTKISNFAFFGCNKLTQITISKSIIEIGSHAFGGCTSLEQIILPKSLRKIDVDAFNLCRNLRAIVIDDSDQEAFDRIGRLIPEEFKSFIIPQTLWCEIKKAKEQALTRTQPIGMTSFPLRDPMELVNLIQQMEGSLQDVMNQVPLPYLPEQLDLYKQNLQRALDTFKEQQDARHQRPARIAVINKLRQIIKVNQKSIQKVENKTESFFNNPKNISNLHETHARIVLAGKLIGWLHGSKTISFDEGERALLAKPRSSFALILENGGIDVEQLPKPPVMGLEI